MEPQCDMAALVQAQLEAYNRHDVAAFVATYTPTAELYDHPGTLTMKGRDAIRDSYGRLFERFPRLRAEVKHRTVTKNHVVDEETVTLEPGGPTFVATAVYKLDGCLISRVDFID